MKKIVLHKDRPMKHISIRVPEDVLEDLKRIAPLKGIGGYQALIKFYIGQGLRRDLRELWETEHGKIASVLSETEFTKVESIGKRHLLANGSQAEQNSGYVVREGDSLWQIAAEQLGNGSRCSEIAELNAGVLGGGDNLSVGMRLKMPAR